MLLLSCVITFAIFLLQLHTSQVLATVHAVCHSVDDPHMMTFDGTPYEFHHDGAHFILYTDQKDTRVTAGYQKCSYNQARCNCAVYVKKGDQIAFIDFCRVSDYKSPLNKFYTVAKSTNDIYGPQSIKQMNCKPILPNQVDDDKIWADIISYNQYFKCAQIGDGNYVTYVLRAYDSRSPGDSVKVQVDIRPLSMPRLSLTPSPNSFEHTGGLCGMWNNNRNKDLYILDDNGNEKYGVNDVQLKNFWSLDTIWRPYLNGKRSASEKCPECFIKAERKLYCPCDNFSLTQELSNNITRENFCETPMPNCIEKSLNLPESTIDPLYPTTTAGPSTTTPGPDQSTTTDKPQISIEEATELCINGIINNSGLKPIIEAGVFDATNAVQNCINDLILTNGNLIWVQTHLELSLIEALQNVLQNETYYQNGTITDAGLALLIGLCPGGCGQNGQCVINQDCINVNAIAAENVLECITPVKCECKDNFGGPDCSINTLEPPSFTLNKRCCDVRNYDCGKLIGYGYPVARRTKLFYKVIYSETDNTFTFDGQTTGLATVISDNEFTLSLPLNDYWRQNTSYVDVSIGISYNNINYKYQSVQLYDSKCRYCDYESGQVSNDAIKDETCLIENSCFNDGEIEPENEDNICDVNTNPFEWTYIGYTSPECNNSTHAWSQWYNLDDPAGDGDIEILTLQQNLTCQPEIVEAFTIDDIPAIKTKQNFYLDKAYGFICMNNEQTNGQCLDFKIRQCCRKEVEQCDLSISLNGDPILVNENDGFAKVTVSLSNNCKLDNDLRIDFHTEPGTATSVNFVILANSITFKPGENSQEIKIQILDNNLIEPFKYFTLVIDKVSVENYVIDHYSKVIYIKDDDYGKPGADIGTVFDTLRREHALLNTNVALLDPEQVVPDEYALCPGSGGLSSEFPTMSVYLTFLDSVYEVFTIETHNPTVCNAADLTARILDLIGNPINNDLFEPIKIDGELFIDLKSPRNQAKVIGDRQLKVETVKFKINETKDGENPTDCEFRVFGRKMPGL